MTAILRRRGARAVLIVLAALLLAALAAPLLVPADSVRDLVVARVRRTTGADVSFGRASVRLLPRLSVSVADGRVRGTGAALAQATGQPSPLVSYEATLARLDVSVAVGPLLRRRLEIGRVQLVRPVIEVVTAPPAAAADSGAAARAAPAADAGAGRAPAAPAFALALAGLEVRDGALRWREEGTARAVAVEGWQQQLTGGDLTALVARLQALGGGAGGAAGAAGASGVGGAAGGPAAAGDARLRLQTRVGSLALHGFGKGPAVTLRDLAATGEVSAPADGGVRLAIERAAWASLALSGEARLGALAAPARLAGTWTLAEVAVATLLADLRPLLPPAPPGPFAAWLDSRPVTAGKLSARGSFDLPWPLPPAPDGAAATLAGLRAEGALAGVRVTLPLGQGEAGVDAAFALAGTELRVTRLQVKDAAGRLDLGGDVALTLPPAAGPLRAQLAGQADVGALAAVAALLPRPAREPGRPPAPGLEAYRLTGQARLSARAEIPAAPSLAQPLAWREALQRGTLPGIALRATAAPFSVAGLWLEPPLQVGSLRVESDLRTARIELEGAQHPALAGRGTVTLTRFVPAPRADVELRLERFDADRLTAMVAAGAGSAAAGSGAAAPVASAAAPSAAAAPAPSGHPLLDWIVGVAVAAAPPAGAAAAAATPPGELIPPGLVADYRATAAQMTLGKLDYRQVELAGQLANRVFDVPRASARLATGTVAGSAKLDYASDPWGLLAFQADIQEVPAGALLAPYVKAAAQIWEGKVGGHVAGGCGLKDQKAVLGSLAVAGEAISTNGVIHGSSFLAGITPYLGARQDLKEIRFKDLRHYLQVENGRYNIRDLKLTGFDTDWWGDGWFAFDGTLDLALGVRLPAGFTPQVGDLSPLLDSLRDADGRIALGLRLTGQASKPAVAVDLTAAKAKTQQRVQDEVKKGVQGLLDKLKRK